MSAHALLYRRTPQPAQPDRAGALFARGNALRTAGRLAEAIEAYDAALKLRPAFPEALRAGGIVLRDLDHAEGALRFFREAVRLRPDYRDAVLDLGNLLCHLQRLEDALLVFEAGLRALPGDAALLVNAGTMLHELGRLDQARAVLEAGVAADPRSAKGHLNLGNVLARSFEHGLALQAFDRALALQPDYVAAHTGRGLSLKMLARFDEAAAALEAALVLEPENPFALKNRGELRLLRGDFARGFADYESRLLTYRLELPTLGRRVLPWSGGNLDGRRVLTIADDGLGDVIQFARFLPRVRDGGADVTLLCRPSLQRLLRTLTDGTRVVAEIGPDEAFDVLLPFSSLPLVFATGTDTLPGAPVPYLAAERDRVAHWALRLGSQGFKIAVCWRGSQDWRADRNRSFPRDSLAALAAIPNVRLISLQLGDSMAGEPAFALEHLDDLDGGPDAFVDTAALMANVDLVVACDTSVAHLAGALGRPTFVLLRTVPEWRWMLERGTSPWYPTMRLFRQTRPGSWDDVMARVADAAADLAAQAGDRC